MKKKDNVKKVLRQLIDFFDNTQDLDIYVIGVVE